MPHPRFALLAVGVTLVLLAGCDGARDIIEVPLGEPQSIVSQSDGVRLTLKTDKTGYELGEPIMLTLEVKNTSDARRVFDFSSGCQHDFLVRDDGSLVWNFDIHQACIDALTSIELQPGEVWTRSNVWDQRSNKGEQVGPGSYDVTAELLQAGDPLSTESLKIFVVSDQH